jgi:hypothetical protein
MGKLWIAASVLALAVQSTAAAEHPLTIKVLKIERSARSSYLLLKVENASERRFERTTWSCVFFKGGQPVHEERTSVENVPPRGDAIKREIQSASDFETVECRYLSSVPSTCP